MFTTEDGSQGKHLYNFKTCIFLCPTCVSGGLWCLSHVCLVNEHLEGVLNSLCRRNYPPRVLSWTSSLLPCIWRAWCFILIANPQLQRCLFPQVHWSRCCFNHWTQPWEIIDPSSKGKIFHKHKACSGKAFLWAEHRWIVGTDRNPLLARLKRKTWAESRT